MMRCSAKTSFDIGESDVDGLSRRRFVARAAGAATALSLPASEGDGSEDPQDFSILLLGDTHFDRIEHHDLEWMKEHFAKDIRQVQSYCRLTEEALPKLLATAKDCVARANSPTAFALHVGDLVEGICGNEELAKRHCSEAWQYFERADLGVPMFMTKGNHDVTGPGAVQAYREVLLRRTAEALGRETLDRSSYCFQHGDNLFAVFDAYDRAAIDWLEEVVTGNDFRRLFVLMHLPVVPYDARSNWRVYYHPRHADRRKRLVELLGKHRAIVLCGHLHKYSLIARKCQTGKFVQLAISSVMKKAEPPKRPMFVSSEDYRPQLTDLEPTFSPTTLDQRQAALLEEQPFVEHYEYAPASGMAMLRIGPSGVAAEIYGGISAAKPWRTLDLSGLLV